MLYKGPVISYGRGGRNTGGGGGVKFCPCKKEAGGGRKNVSYVERGEGGYKKV